MKRKLLSLALVLALCLSLAAPAFAAGGFTDVAPGAYYADAVAWAVENGITNGTSPTTFSPNQICNRAQIITFLWRWCDSPAAQAGGVRDIAESDYFYQAVCWAREKGMFEGDTFRPYDPCTRLMAVEFQWKLAGAPAWDSGGFSDVQSDAVGWAVDNYVTTGTGEATFSPDDPCTRGQIATFLYRLGNTRPAVGNYVHENGDGSRFELRSNGSRPEFAFYTMDGELEVSVIEGTLISNNRVMQWADVRVEVYRGYVIVTLKGELGDEFPSLNGKYILQDG